MNLISSIQFFASPIHVHYEDYIEICTNSYFKEDNCPDLKAWIYRKSTDHLKLIMN